MQKLGEVTLKELWYSVFALIIPFICIGGVTYFPYHLKLPLVFLISFLSFFLYLADKKKIRFEMISVSWLIVGLFICISSFYSYDKNNTFTYGLVYVAVSLLLLADFPDKVWERVLKVTNIFVIVYAISIIASVFIDDLIVGKLWFITNPFRYQSVVNQMNSELSSGAYSGLSGEKAEAALAMNVGLGILFAKFFSGEKLKKLDYIEFALVAVALILTGKRMLFLIPVAMFVFLMLVSKIKGKFIKLISATVLSATGVLLLSAFIPQMSNLYNRFFQDTTSKYYDPLSKRGDLWEYCFMMMEEKPLFGFGYASYNNYAYNAGYRRDGKRWNYFAHNCYYELLGEVGIIGAIVIIGLMIIALVMTIKYLMKKDLPQLHRILLMFSLYIQGMMFIYCLSANVLYQYSQIFLWFVAVAILLCVHINYKDKKLFTTISEGMN